MNIVEKIIEVLKTEDRLTSKEVIAKINKRFPDYTKGASIKEQLNAKSRSGLFKREYIDLQSVFSLAEENPVCVAGRRSAVVLQRAATRIIGCYANGKLVASRKVTYPSEIAKYKERCEGYWEGCTFKEFYDLKAIPIMKTLNSLAVKNSHLGIRTPKTNTQQAIDWFINSTGNQIDFMLKNEGIPKIPNHKEQKEVILMLYNKYSQSYSNL